MKYTVIRRGTTVCIGQCSTPITDKITRSVIDRTVKEIRQRLADYKQDNGVTYFAPGFYGLEIDDVARLQYNLSTAVECRIRRNGSYDIISTVTP